MYTEKIPAIHLNENALKTTGKTVTGFNGIFCLIKCAQFSYVSVAKRLKVQLNAIVTTIVSVNKEKLYLFVQCIRCLI